MMGYDYELVFRKGSTNVVADALSRQHEAQLKAVSVVTSDLLTRIQHSWVADPSLVHLLHTIKQQPNKHPKYTWQNNQLRHQGKLVIGQDSQLRDELFKFFHSSATEGHFGVAATMKKM